MKHRLNKKKINMKTRILLTILAAAALTAITLNVNAGVTLLSPRAAGSQAKVVPGVAAAQPASAIQSTSPRALGNEITAVAGGVSEVTPAMACVSNMSGNPKSIQACAEHPGTMPGCNPVAMAR